MDIEACERLDIAIDNLWKVSIIGPNFLYDVKEYINQEDFNKDKQKHFSIIGNVLKDTNTVY